MRIAYISVFLPKEKNLYQKTKHKIYGVAGDKFSSSLVRGLYANEKENLSVFGTINVLNYPAFPKIFFKKENLNIYEKRAYFFGYINLFGIKYITQYINAKRVLKKWIRESENNRIICVYNIFYPLMKAALSIKKKYGENVKICLITGDLPGKYGLVSSSKKTIKQSLIESMERKILSDSRNFDYYGLATDEMAKVLGIPSNKYVVIEAIYSNIEPGEVQNSNEDSKGKKVVFYAGSVRPEYGIEHLLKSFSLIKKENYELWIFGGGEGENIVREYSKTDKRIKFFGFVPPETVNNYLKQATVVVNPRTNDKDFVKYSFPSKTIEGLASGKPFISHNLTCYPSEYLNYIQIAQDNTDQSLADKIEEICELSHRERYIIASKSLKFISKEKNPTVVAKKLLDLIGMNGEEVL